MKSTFLALLSVFLALPALAQTSDVKSVVVYSYAGVPSSGTSEIDTLVIGGTPTGGTFTISVSGGRTTQPISWSATNATLLANIQAALTALPNVGTGGATVSAGVLSGGIGTIAITFTGKNAKLDFPDLSIGTNSLTGTSPTVTVATTTPGVKATFRSAPPGTLLIDSSTPGLYQNTSATLYNPTWTQITVP